MYLLYQDLHFASKSTIFTHYINMSQKDIQKPQNLWLPDRKNSFPVVVVGDTVFTENEG